MRLWSRAQSWARAMLRRDRMENEMDAELRFHVEAYVEDLVRSGATQQEAQRRARIEFGGVEQAKEECREARGVNIVDSLIQDLRYALRTLRKNPAFTTVAVLTLAVGIGANTAIFSVVDAVLLRPLAIKDPSGVVYIHEQWQGMFPGVSVGNFVDVQQQSASFAKLSGSYNAGFNLATEETPERVDGEYVTASYFSTFEVQAIAGRVFSVEEDTPGHERVVVISERLWRTHFHTDEAIVGQALRINGMPYTVIGVMPKTFDPLLSKSDLWIPTAFSPVQLADHDNHYLSVMGRLKPSVSVAEAQSELNVIAQRLQQQYPIDDKERGFEVQPLTAVLLGDQRLALRLMLAAVGFLLLIACANIANMQLARSRWRQKEIAIRAALGAAPRQIIRQLLVENALLGLVSGVAGLFLAFWGVSWIVTHGPGEVPRLNESRIDGVTLAFACGIALSSGVLFGLVPALRCASTELSEAFKAAGATLSISRDHVRSSLVVGEVALALILMAGAGLMIRSALLVSRVDPGFDTSNLVVGRIGLPDAGYHDPTIARQTFERMIAATATLPGVISTAVVSRAPLAGGGGSNGIIAEGRPVDPSSAIDARLRIISAGYLSTVRIPFRSGRDFSSQDTRDKRLVTIVNETLARTLWPGIDPIGKRFACCEAGPKGRMDPVWHEVVGVVADVRAWGLDRPVRAEFYLPIAQMPSSAWDWIGRTMDLVVRTEGEAIPAHELQITVASIAPGVPIYQLSSMGQKIAGTLERSHFDTFLLTVFAATALLLSSVGIYGLLSYIVAQRNRDIGIRRALGATPQQILREVIGHGARLTFVGLVLGLAGAVTGTRLLSSLLYGVGSTDGLTFAAVSFLLVVVALLASYVPARRATRVDPMVALRHD